MENNWRNSGDNYFINKQNNIIPKLEPCVYELNDSMFGPYLTKVSDNFNFTYKVYGVNHNLIDRVKRTYNAKKENLGVLLTGIKGTGKTVTAKLICNKLELPTILVKSADIDLDSFLSDVHQDVILFIDEFEKVYLDKSEDALGSKGNHGTGSTLLSLMDGVGKSDYTRVFILTTNTMDINTNMIDRPGRIRYVKTFGNLEIEVIDEIVEDLLIHKHLKNETIKYIASLELITIDIIKSIIEEVNIHEEPPSEFKNVFNVTEVKKELSVYKIKFNDKGEEEEDFEGITNIPHFMNDDGTIDIEEAIFSNLYVKSKNLGEIIECNDCYITCSKNGKYNHETGMYDLIKTKYLLKLTKSINSHFRNYEFAI